MIGGKDMLLNLLKNYVRPQLVIEQATDNNVNACLLITR